MSLTVAHEPHYWVLIADIRSTERIRSVPGARAKRKTDPGVAVWRVPCTIGAAKQIKATLPEAEWTEGAKAQRAELAMWRKVRLSLVQGNVHKEGNPRLNSAQQIGVEYLRVGSGVLADSMGTGKTVMASVALSEDQADQVLVLTTKSTLGVWRDHLLEWTTITPFIFHGPKRAKVHEEFMAHPGPKALVSTHALARSHSNLAGFGHIAAEGEPGEFNQHWDVCVVDEAHKMSGVEIGKGTRALWRIGETCAVRWALTGTPVNERPDDLWNLMRFVEPDVFTTSRKAFRERYCMMQPQFFGGLLNAGVHPQMEDELHWILEPYFMRRLKSQVLADLPTALPVQEIRLPMTNAQRTLYNKLAKGMIAMVGGEMLIAPDQLDLSMKLQYVANGVPEVDEDGAIVGLVPDRTKSNKLDYLLDVAEERQGDPFVVYAFSSKVVDMLHQGLTNAGHTAAKITGKVSASDRDSYIKAFQAGTLDVILLTDAGAEGITLTAADLIVFATESWRAPINQQVKDRIDRWGQTRPPSTIILISEDTVDETRRTAVEGKVDMQQQILKDKTRVKQFVTGGWEADV